MPSSVQSSRFARKSSRRLLSRSTNSHSWKQSFAIYKHPEASTSTVCSVRWFRKHIVACWWRRYRYYNWDWRSSSRKLEIRKRNFSGTHSLFLRISNCFDRRSRLHKRARHLSQWGRCTKIASALQEKAETYIKTPKPMEPRTAEGLQNFSAATTCHICEQPLGAERVQDHCHITGNYRGAAHNNCNLM